MDTVKSTSGRIAAWWRGTAGLVFLASVAQAQVSTADLDHFWTLCDSVAQTTDTLRQLHYVNRLYIGKASPGLAAFMRNKDDLPRSWLAFLKENPDFWASLRAKMPVIEAAAGQVKREITRFRMRYPALKPAETYFLVGLGRQGGTIRGTISLLCVEVLLRDPAAGQEQLVFTAVHEYVHTQQKRPDFQNMNVLTASIREGACDFVAEQVTGLPVRAPYATYGRGHEEAVWTAFQNEMYTRQTDNWVSTGPNPALPAPDLGYFVGYQICRSYYRKAPDKAAALKEIIELDFEDPAAVTRFWHQSGYTGESR